MNYARNTKNYIFRWFECGLTVEETAKLCFKSVITVTKWDKGRPIPRECRLLMELAAGKKMAPLNDSWDGWRLSGDHLICPDGVRYTAKRIKALDFAVSTSKQANPEIPKLIRQRLNRV